MTEPRRIGDSLEGVVRGLRPDAAGVPAATQLGGLFGRWDEAVGPAVAAHVQPVALDRGVLTVAVDDPGWATQIRLLEGTMRDRLTEVAGVRVDRLEVRVQRRR